MDDKISYLPIDLLPKELTESRSYDLLSKRQKEEVDKIPFIAERIIVVENDSSLDDIAQ